MDDPVKKPRTLRELVEESRFWDVSDLMRNFDEEFHRVELGLGHTAWDSANRPVSMCMRPLPTVPRFEVSETEDELVLRVHLPGVPAESIQVDVDRMSLEVFACSDDLICKPYYVSVDSRSALDQGSVEARRDGHWVEIKVRKSRKRRVDIR